MFASPGAIAFQIPAIFGFGPFPVRWYGILMATSIVVGLWVAHRQAKREGLPADDLISVAQWSILAGIIGARFYEVIFNWDYYGQQPWKIPAVWEGGLAMHGGLIVGPLVGVLLAWKWHVPILKGLDVIAPAMVLGQAIGRWGNFFNEAIWDFAVFVALVSWLRPSLRQYPGALFFCYIGLYSIGRFAIEALRLDSFWLGNFRVPQLASVLGVLVAVIGLAWTRHRSSPVPAS